MITIASKNDKPLFIRLLRRPRRSFMVIDVDCCHASKPSYATHPGIGLNEGKKTNINAWWRVKVKHAFPWRYKDQDAGQFALDKTRFIRTYCL